MAGVVACSCAAAEPGGYDGTRRVALCVELITAPQRANAARQPCGAGGVTSYSTHPDGHGEARPAPEEAEPLVRRPALLRLSTQPPVPVHDAGGRFVLLRELLEVADEGRVEGAVHALALVVALQPAARRMGGGPKCNQQSWLTLVVSTWPGDRSDRATIRSGPAAKFQRNLTSTA